MHDSSPTMSAKAATALAAVFAALTTVFGGYAIVDRALPGNPQVAGITTESEAPSYYFAGDAQSQNPDMAMTQEMIDSYRLQIEQDRTCWNQVVLVEGQPHWPTICQGQPDQETQICTPELSPLSPEETNTYQTWQSSSDQTVPEFCR